MVSVGTYLYDVGMRDAVVDDLECALDVELVDGCFEVVVLIVIEADCLESVALRCLFVCAASDDVLSVVEVAHDVLV